MSKIVNVDDILFTKEAAEYLNISVQRLHKLVQDGVLAPLKKTSSGMLFSIESLDSRIKALDGLNEVSFSQAKKPLDLDTEFMKEVLNYYTLQSFFSNSDKKTQAALNKYSKQINLGLDIRKIVVQLSELVNVSTDNVLNKYKEIYKSFRSLSDNVIIIKRGSQVYPELLSSTEEAPPFLFMMGNIDLLKTNIVSVVGSRNSSKEGLEKAYHLSTLLGKRGVTVASGLARGIDTYALKGSVENRYNCIAVIGTPINNYYPKENKNLQDYIAENGLLISQFPPSASIQRWNFPLRNSVMSGISLATAIVEASETSGALKQADYALKQNRIVFIPTSAVENINISWPKKYLKRKGANQFTRIDELLMMLENHKVIKEVKKKDPIFNGQQIDIFSINNKEEESFHKNREIAKHVFKYE